MNAHKARLYFSLQRTATELKAAADRALTEAASITTSQAAVLAAVKDQGPVRQNALAEMLEQNEAAITQMLSKLESRGLVARHRSSDDQRAWDVEISEKGLDALSAAGPAFAEINALLDAALEEDQCVFVDRLAAIRRALKTL